MGSWEENSRLFRLQSNLKIRARILELARCYFRDNGFLEVDTPTRVPQVAPELNIFPFESESWYLSTSPEIYMKRLLAAGYDKIFQFCHCFRKEESGRWHNSEFLMLEWYHANADYSQILQETEELFNSVARGMNNNSELNYQGTRINLTSPWPRFPVRETFKTVAGWDPAVINAPDRFDIDLVTKIIPAFPADKPAILLDYPAAMGSLARLKPGHPEIAERAEVFIGGLELANAYSELTDRAEQEKRFLKEIESIGGEQGRKAAIPGYFLEALETMPPCGGIALGVDRMVMLFCNAASIEEVVPFTTKRA